MIKQQLENVMDLSGIWKYKLDKENIGENAKFYEPQADRSDWSEMKVPNNWYLTEVGDFFGAVWFKTEFDAPKEFTGKRLTLKLNAVDYFADVWLNGKYLGHHEGYFTPFEYDVTDTISFS